MFQRRGGRRPRRPAGHRRAHKRNGDTMNFPKRKRNRLQGHDYSSNGAYFITICTKEMRCILARASAKTSPVGGGVLDAPPPMILTDIGKSVQSTIETNCQYFHGMTVDKYVIMPNHIHFLISIRSSSFGSEQDINGGASRTPPPTSGVLQVTPANELIPAFVSTVKRFSNAKCEAKLFQRSYHDHIIRDDADYRRIWKYIDENPLKWALDRYYIPDEA